MKNLLIITIVFFVIFLFWAISIGITYWDAVSRRKLPGGETAAWIALVVLIPGIGFVGYLFGRILSVVLSPRDAILENRQGGTRLKHPPELDHPTGTVMAAALAQPRPREAAPTQMDRSASAGGAQKFKLLIIAGPHNGLEFNLDNLPVKIGRGSGVLVTLDEDLGVSRVHAEIYELKGTLRIRDLSSAHGTRVNDLTISDTEVAPGDLIRVGESILMVGTQGGF